MELHKIGVKLFAQSLPDDLLGFIPVFHRWIQEQLDDDLLIDVADYTHVHRGPGVMVIAHQGNYALDEAEGRRGLVYYAKRELPGDQSQRLGLVLGRVLGAARRLEQDPELGSRVRFRGDQLQIFANDRLAAPNDPATFQALEPVLNDLLGRLYGGDFQLEQLMDDPRERLTVNITAAQAADLDTLLGRLKD
ncbi:MAG: hypothetical protein R3310_10370 [Candidatus Competibacteraceae bacterium]|nr:hypothetical protein [Candidatus Competibacteraceae bacterium]